MKKIVRKGVFETNSSSTHSLSVASEHKEFILDTIYPDQNGVVHVSGQEFGWGWDRFNDAETKLAYAFQDSFGNEDLIKEVVMEQTGATEVIFNENGGYIDHDGVGTTGDIRGNKEDLRNFIFNKNSWLFIGNDNSSPDPTFYLVPEYKDGKLCQPEFKFELVIDGIQKTTKYLDVPNEEELQDGIDSILDGAYLSENGEFIVDDSLFWQINRPRNTLYTKGWGLKQDYSKGEVLFLKENDPRWRELEDKMRKEWNKEKTKGTPKLNYFERYELLTEEARKLDGLIKAVKFEIKEIK